MEELHVSTEVKESSKMLKLITRIISDLWYEKDKARLAYEQAKSENDVSWAKEEKDYHMVEEEHQEGIMDGLDLAMEIVVSTICPDYMNRNVYIPQDK